MLDPWWLRILTSRNAKEQSNLRSMTLQSEPRGHPKHKQNSQKIPGQSREDFVYVFYLYVFFCSLDWF